MVTNSLNLLIYLALLNALLLHVQLTIDVLDRFLGIFDTQVRHILLHDCKFTHRGGLGFPSYPHFPQALLRVKNPLSTAKKKMVWAVMGQLGKNYTVSPLSGFFGFPLPAVPSSSYSMLL